MIASVCATPAPDNLLNVPQAVVQSDSQVRVYSMKDDHHHHHHHIVVISNPPLGHQGQQHVSVANLEK